MHPIRFLKVATAASVILGLAAGQAFGGEAEVRSAMKRVLPEYSVDKVAPSPVKGLYEVVVGPQVMFVTEDGRYLIDGAVVDLETRKDVVEASRSQARKAAIDKIGEDNMIVFDAPNPKSTVTVFTDIDCGYCQKLHSKMDGYGKEGISIRYMFYPRAGKRSSSYTDAVSVWCADDRKEAITRAKAGGKVAKKSCDNPVDEHMKLAQLLGVRGTPAIILENGEMVGGYMPPKRLAARIKASR